MTVGLSAAAVHPLDTLDPAAPLGDLAWLDEAIGDARVVAIGEEAHYNHEFLQLRHRIMRYLVQRHGFRACAVESGYVEGRLVHDWVRGGAGELGPVLAHGLTSLMGVWQPVRAQLEWLRAHNRDAAHPVAYYGVDLPASMVSLLSGLDAVTGYLARADAGFAPDPAPRRAAATFAAESAFSATHAAQRYGELDDAGRDAITAGLAALHARLTQRQAEYERRTSAAEYEWVLRALRTTMTLEEFVRAQSRGDAAEMMRLRDTAMADTVEEILHRDGRVVLAAHNQHVQRTDAQVPPLGWMTPLGAHLAERLGEDYLVIATTSGPGESLNIGADFFAGRLFGPLGEPGPDSLDGVLAASHDGPFGVDLRRLAPADAAALRAVRGQCFGLAAEYSELDPLDAFDAVLHVPRVSAAEPDADALVHAPVEVAEVFANWASIQSTVDSP